MHATMLVGQWLNENMTIVSEVSNPKRLASSLCGYLSSLPAPRGDQEGIDLEVQQVSDGHEIGKMVTLVIASSKVPTAAVYRHYPSGGIKDGPSAGSATKLNRAFEIRESEEGVLGLAHETEEAALEVISMDLGDVAALVEIEDRVLRIGVRHKWLPGRRKRRRKCWSEVHEDSGWIPFDEVVGLHNAHIGCRQ